MVNLSIPFAMPFVNEFGLLAFRHFLSRHIFDYTLDAIGHDFPCYVAHDRIAHLRYDAADYFVNQSRRNRNRLPGCFRRNDFNRQGLLR